ncbi:hypothetical protein [Pseudopontixanthobacter vadosimaris]|uniref:hypothetical protein n=1 Tax=Pseudopontixanthobacter vadosimaris TaxID=2726450 RepID=UPI001F112956|nr:hypothetical protein [Pseudopontixanthobacter vadosimaris]
MPPDMGLTTDLTFASDAEILGLWGLAFIVLALLGERRRIRRDRIDQVGWVPWTGLFLICGVIAAAFITLSVKGLITN